MRPVPKGNVIAQVGASPAAMQEETHAPLCFRTHMRDRHASVHACGTNLTPTQILCARWCTRAPTETHAMFAYPSLTGIEANVFQDFYIYIYTIRDFSYLSFFSNYFYKYVSTRQIIFYYFKLNSYLFGHYSREEI